ncbi:DUF1205 domain-containing protein [Dactylosporangium fulvum]
MTIAPLHTTRLTAMVPFCWALRATGHELLVACVPDLVETIRGAGLNAVVIGESAGADAAHPFPAAPPGTLDAADCQRLHARPNVEHAERTAAEHIGLAEGWGADVVLFDQTVFTGRVVAAALGLPAVAHRAAVEPASGVYDEYGRQQLAGLCGHIGLHGLPDPDMVVDPCPPSLRDPDVQPGRAIRFVPFDGAGTVPDWAGERPAKPRICMAAGDALRRPGNADVARRAVEALAGLDGVDLVAVMRPADHAAVGELPDRFRLAESTPLNVVLQTCAVSVGFGDPATGLTAAAAGIPQLVLPHWPDQVEYGARLAATGAGITVPAGAAQHDVAALRAAAERLLHEHTFRMEAQRLQAEIADAPAANDVVSLVEDLARQVPAAVQRRR